MKFHQPVVSMVAAALLLMLIGFNLPGDINIPHRVDATATSRKLQDNGFDCCVDKKTDNAGKSLDLEDYHKIDPSPSSKALVKPGPIEHGTPLLPFLPQPPPPGPPSHD